MSLAAFELRVASGDVGKNDQLWFPKWVRRYAMNFSGGLVSDLPVNRSSVIKFSQSLLKNGAPAWQRLQAVRALECYRDLVLRRSEPDLSEVILTLSRLAKRERNFDVLAPPTAEELQKLRGNVNKSEPPLIQTMRGELRVLHYSMATERAYVRWAKRFSRHLGSMALERFDEKDIGDFLTTLAIDNRVSPSTQNQAQAALLFVYQCVIGKKIGFLNAVRARRQEPIPVWFSKSEITCLLEHFVGVHRLMFLLIYGAGLRHKECRRLRIKDICFDQRHIVVRDGKGGKDRITFLPEQAITELKRQIAVAKRLHEIDVEQGYEQVYMPYALAVKYPNACRELAWKWVFPSRQRSRDKRSGTVWRHHVGEAQFSAAFKRGLRLSGIPKFAVPHTLRHSFATHLVEGGTDIQTVQKLMGHKDVQTTMGYVHASVKLGVDIKSPVDAL